jgi:hypothetical protein
MGEKTGFPVRLLPAGKWQPKFADYDVVVSNYNGASWSNELKASFQAYVHNGGGFVSIHAADNSFADWPEYNEMFLGLTRVTRDSRSFV